MLTWASQVVVIAAFSQICGGCDSPARVKPWRHAPDPMAEAAHAPRSPALGDGTAASEVRAARGHTLRIQLDSDPGRLDPLVRPSRWARRILVGPVFEPLIHYVPPEPGAPAGRYEPRLARSWRVVTPPWGGQEIRIELEPGVKFHDGRPLTSSDVQFTLDSVRDRRRHVDHLRPMLADVSAVELITPTEVRLVLDKPVPAGWVLRALAEIPILPMHVYKDHLPVRGALVGTGPWKVTQTKHGTIHLTRFDHYWGRAVAIRDVELVYQPDAASALKDAKRGEFDIIPALIPEHYPEQATAPGTVAAFAPLQLAPPQLRLFAFNTTKTKPGPLDDVRVRHALGLLVDRKEIAQRYFHRLARPATWPIWPGGLVHGTEPPIAPYDPKAAAALLDAAGWKDTDKDGIRDRDGVELRVEMVGGERPKEHKSADSSGRPIKLPRDYLIEAARRIGVVIDLKTGGAQWVEKRIREGKYDLAELEWSGMADMDLRPWLGGASPEVDRVLDEMSAVWDPAGRAKLAGELAGALEASWPIIGIVTEAPQGLVAHRVRGVHVWDGWVDLSRMSFAPR